MSRVRVVLVDDEPLARAGIRALLRPHSDIDVLAECGDGWEAVERIEALEPDVVFLDVQMPGMDGFGVIGALSAPMPLIVFVTAYDEYALEAFRVHAADYLLKPVDPGAFEQMIAHVRTQLEQADARIAAGMQLRRLLDEYERIAGAEPPRYLPRIFVRDGERGFFIRTADIEWAETADNYVRIAAAGRIHLVRATMHDLEQKLDPQQFARIHRRTLINLERVREVFVDFRGSYVVRMSDGTEHRLSRTFRERLLGWAV